MEKPKFTPGPWWTDGQYNEDEAGLAVIAANTDSGPLPGNPTRGMVAFASELLSENAQTCAANARLISAAPDLYAAARLGLNYIENTEAELGIQLSSGDALRAALSKANGEGGA
tara:strand:+ start:19 stop:360 length:342 start_codon:yes stop_codon:yes gene_type:complete